MFNCAIFISRDQNFDFRQIRILRFFFCKILHRAWGNKREKRTFQMLCLIAVDPAKREFDLKYSAVSESGAARHSHTLSLHHPSLSTNWPAYQAC